MESETCMLLLARVYAYLINSRPVTMAYNTHYIMQCHVIFTVNNQLLTTRTAFPPQVLRKSLSY